MRNPQVTLHSSTWTGGKVKGKVKLALPVQARWCTSARILGVAPKSKRWKLTPRPPLGTVLPLTAKSQLYTLTRRIPAWSLDLMVDLYTGRLSLMVRVGGMLVTGMKGALTMGKVVPMEGSREVRVVMEVVVMRVRINQATKAQVLGINELDLLSKRVQAKLDLI